MKTTPAASLVSALALLAVQGCAASVADGTDAEDPQTSTSSAASVENQAARAFYGNKACQALQDKIELETILKMTEVYICSEVLPGASKAPKVIPNACVIVQSNGVAVAYEVNNAFDATGSNQLIGNQGSYSVSYQNFSYFTGVGKYTTLTFDEGDLTLEVSRSWYQIPAVPTRITDQYTSKCQLIYKEG